MCKESVIRVPEFCERLTFPLSPKQPGPRDGVIQCFIKRDKSKQTYHLYLCLSPDVLVEDGKFLLSAKRIRHATRTEYIISSDADNVSRSSSSYIGEMRSNFFGTKYIVYDTHPPYNGSATLCPPGPSGSYNIAQVAYQMNALSPRGMHCIMSTTSPVAENGEEVEIRKEKPLVLRSKVPWWHEKIQRWCLNFRGRVTIASIKNFQLLAAATQASVAGAPITSSKTAAAPLPSSDQEKIILQFGRVGKDMFTMDYRCPLSAFQAFAICLSNFDTKFGSTYSATV